MFNWVLNTPLYCDTVMFSWYIPDMLMLFGKIMHIIPKYTYTI